MYIRDGSGPASIGRAAGVSSFFSGSLSGQSPQNFDPPLFKSSRSFAMTDPVHTPLTDDVRASPRTRCPYGSAQPQTIRPSHSMTSVDHGQLHWNLVARKFRDTPVP